MESTSSLSDVEQTDGLISLGSFKIWKNHKEGVCRQKIEFLYFSQNIDDRNFHKQVERKTDRSFLCKRRSFDKFDDAQLTAFMLEVNSMRCLEHDNLLKLFHVVVNVPFDDFYLAFEDCDFTLAVLLNYATVLTAPIVKNIMLQLLTGLSYLHSAPYCHGSLCAENILLNEHGKLKIADYANVDVTHEISDDDDDSTSDCHWSNLGPTLKIEILRYRPLEYLLGSKKQHPSLDMWSVGCIFAELLKKKQIFSGATGSEIVKQIMDLLGLPNEKCFPGISKLLEKCGIEITQIKVESLLSYWYSEHSVNTTNLLHCLLIYDSFFRLPAEKCLKHKYFKDHPVAGSEGDLKSVLTVLSPVGKIS